VCFSCTYGAMDSLSGGGVGEGFQRFEMEDREEKMRKGRFRLGVLTLFRSLQEKTTAHGLPHVHNARGTHDLSITQPCHVVTDFRRS